MFSVTRDVRLACRMLLQSKTFSAMAVLAFALGVAANSAVFSVVNSVLLRPLGYADPDRLVFAAHNGMSPVAPATFLDWQRDARSFEQMAVAQAWGGSLRGTERPEPLVGLRVGANMFSLLGVPPMLGRTFTHAEDREGSEPAVVIAHSLWLRSFGGARDVVGRRIDIDGVTYTIVGVMPKSFQFAPMWITNAEIWTPFVFGERRNDRNGQSLRVFARLKPGVSTTAAQAEMSTIMSRLEQQYPDSSAKLGVAVVPLADQVVGGIRTLLLVLLGTAGFVLLIACANVANLMLVRASARRREMAVRLALGASRWQITRQTMIESLVLALVGGGIGLALATAGITALEASLPPGSIPRQHELGMDGRAVAFAWVIAVFTGLIAGFLPGRQMARRDVNEVLNESGRSQTDNRHTRRTRNVLIVCETALAFVLLIGAGLMLRSFGRLLSLDPGFDSSNLITMEVSVSGTAQADPGRRENYYREVINRTAGVPGVTSVSAVNHAPITGDVWGTRFRIDGRPEPRPGEEPSAVYRVSWPGYFQTMRAPVVRGRDFQMNDTRRSQPVVLINEAAARRYWPNEDPVGRRISVAGEPWTVIGVVSNLKQSDWTAAPREELYFSLLQSKHYLEQRQRHYEFISIVARVGQDPAGKIGAIRNAIESIDRRVLLSNVITMEQAVANELWRSRLSLLLLGGFGFVALTLALTGIYGVISHAVSQRTREIGVRMAFGAMQRDVLMMSLRQGLAPVAAGIAAGGLMALATTRLMRTLLYGIEATDPTTFAAIAGLMAFAGLFAAFWPAWRAARVQPMDALRR